MITLESLQTARELAPTSHFSTLIFGDVRVGKTTLAISANDVTEMRRVLHLDFGNSARTMYGDERYGDVITQKIRSVGDLTDLYTQLAPADLMAAAGYEGEVGNGIYDMGINTIIFDEIDMMHTLTLRERMGRVVELSQLSDDKRKSGPRSIFDVELRDWQFSYRQLLQLIDWWLELPVYFIGTVRFGKSLNEQTGIEEIVPGLPGQLARDIPGKFDVVGYLNMRPAKTFKGETEPTRTMQFNQDGIVGTVGIKNAVQASRVGSELVDPTMGDLYYAMNQGE